VASEDVTVVMTTHDVGFMEIADQIYQLEDGEIVEE
jgi:putative ABC transport system ATP-binding protein